MLDLQAAAALGAQGLEGQLPGDIGLEVGGAGAGPQDDVLELGALLDEGADLILQEAWQC